MTMARHEDLEGASLDTSRASSDLVRPGNATLTLTGDFDVPATKKLIEKWFGSFPKSEKPKVVAVPAPAIRSQQLEVDDEFAKQRQITFAWHTPANVRRGRRRARRRRPMHSRVKVRPLYKALVYDRPTRRQRLRGTGWLAFSGVFSVTVTLRPEAKIGEVKSIVAAEIARIGKELLSEKEIARVIAANEADTIRRSRASRRGETLQAYNHYLGEPDKITWDLDGSAERPREDRATVAKYLLPDRIHRHTTPSKRREVPSKRFLVSRSPPLAVAVPPSPRNPHRRRTLSRRTADASTGEARGPP